MNLTVDVGNTSLKLTFIEQGSAVEVLRFALDDLQAVGSAITRHQTIAKAIVLYSSQRSIPLERVIEQGVEQLLVFDNHTKVPMVNLYASPNTLGRDRLAAALGAKERFEGCDVMIVDFGTAITIDIVNCKGEYLGGNISLGLNSRYRALNDYTFCLPLCSVPNQIVAPATSSTQAIESGVMLSVIFEIEGYIKYYKNIYKDIKIVFTGGDGCLFAEKIGHNIIADNDLVSAGLNRILEYNAN